MSNTFKDSLNQKKTLNILFFALILLCSYSTVLNKLNNKAKKTNALKSKDSSEFPNLNLTSIPSLFKSSTPEDSEKNQTSKAKAKGKEMQTQKRFESEIAKLDSQNQTLNVTELNLSSEALKCYEKFALVIKNFPLEIQSEIVSQFQNYFAKKQAGFNNANFDDSVCCLSESLIKSASKKLNAITKAFTVLIEKQENECKNGFACFRGNEVLVKAMGKEVDSAYKNKNQAALKNLLKDGKTQNSNLIKCLVHLQKISVRNLGMICANDDLLAITFVRNAENKLLKPKKFPEDDSDLFANCGDYVKNFNLYPEEITNAFVDSINFLLGSEQCNYFSDFFGGKQKGGRKALNPKMFAAGKKDKKNLLQSSKDFVKDLFGGEKNNNVTGLLNATFSSEKTALLKQFKSQLPKGDTTALLLEKWASCASAVKNFAKESVESLKANLRQELSENPTGLLNGVLEGVNFKEIQSKFDAVSNPQFLLSCEAAAGCKLSLGEGSNVNNVSASLNKTNVVTKANVTLDYSCCDRICVVTYYNDNYANQTVANEALAATATAAEEVEDELVQNGFDTILPVEFVQVSKNQNKHKKQFFDKLLKTVGLGKNSTNATNGGAEKQRRTRRLILSGAEVFEIKAFNKFAEKRSKKQTEKIESALESFKLKPENVSFSDVNLLNLVSNFTKKPEAFVNDERIKVALMLNIKLEDGNSTTLADFIAKKLVASQSLLYFACAEGKCKLTENGQEVKRFELAPNTDYSLYDKSISKKLLNKVENNLLNNSVTKNMTNNGLLKGVSNLFSSNKKSEAEKGENTEPSAFDSAFDFAEAKDVKKHLKRFSENLDKAVDSDFAERELYYRPNYRDLQANFTLDALDPESVKQLVSADVSKFAIKFLPEFNKTLFLEALNKDFAQSFTLELECSEYFCVLAAKANSALLAGDSENGAKATLLLQVRQRKAYAFNTQRLSITQKKCIVKHILLNGKQEPEFFELGGVPEVDLTDLSKLNSATLNSTIDSALSLAPKKNKTNIIEVCNIETPYTNLPISSDCLSSLVGHCQKSNFFDLYNRYTRGIASYDDLPAAAAAQNTCVSPAECAKVDANSAKAEKEKCGAAISQMLFVGGSRLSLAKLITPCNGDLPAASVEPIAFVSVRNRNLLKSRKVNSSNEQSGDSSAVIDFSKLSEEQRNLLNKSKVAAEQNTEVNVSIDGVTKDPASVHVEADLATINANVEEAQKSVVEQVQKENAQNSAVKLGFGFYTCVLMIFALLI